jgi:hypothetical protein
MDLINLALVALLVPGYGWYRTWRELRAERASVKTERVLVGAFGTNVRANFFDTLVRETVERSAGLELLSEWVRDQYVTELQSLGSERDRDETLRRQGSSDAFLRTYNVIKTAAIQASKK